MTLSSRQNYGALLFLCAVFFFLALGDLNLTDNDEGSNAEAPREMLQRGDWVSPTLNGEPRFAKPVFTYWLIQGSYRVFGVNEFSARIPSAVFGTLLVLMQYWFLLRVATSRVAWWSALCLLLNLEILAIGRMVLTDMILVFFTTLTLFSFWIAFSEGKKSRHWYLLCYVASAGAMLTKGPVGVLIPLLAVFSFGAFTQGLRKILRESYPVIGTIVFCCLAFPWYWAMITIHGEVYLESAQANTFGRYTNIIGGHGGTVLFYIPVFLLGFLPWSGFFPAAFRAVVSDFKMHRVTGGAGSSLLFFSACWFVSVFIFFTVSATRLPHYIAPLFPAAAILVAFPIVQLMNGTGRSKATSAFWIVFLVGVTLGSALIIFPFAYGNFVEFIAQEFPMAESVNLGIGIAVIGVVMVIGYITAGVFGLLFKQVGKAIRVMALTIGMSALLIIHVGLPVFDKNFLSPPQELAAFAGECIESSDNLVVYGRKKPSYIFYAQHDIIFTHKGYKQPLEKLLNKSESITMITQNRLLEELPKAVQALPVIRESSGYILLSEKRC